MAAEGLLPSVSGLCLSPECSEPSSCLLNLASHSDHDLPGQSKPAISPYLKVMLLNLMSGLPGEAAVRPETLTYGSFISA